MLGKILKDLRTSKKVTQKELAQYLGLTPKMISFYELDQRTPPADMLMKLSKYFGVSIDYLLGKTTSLQQSTDLLSPLPQSTLKPDTVETAQKLEALNNDTQRMIKDIIDREYERSSAAILEKAGTA